MDDFSNLLVGMGAMSVIMTIMSLITYRNATSYTHPIQNTLPLPNASSATPFSLPFPDQPPADASYAFANTMQRSTI